MTQSKIKKEEAVTPPPRPGLGSFRGDHEVATTTSNSFAQKPVESVMPDAKWKLCEGNDRFQRVRVKEQAAKQAASALRKISHTLNLHLLANSSCQSRIDKIEEVLARKKEFQVKVGFLGSTGEGKTSAISALIGCKELLPSSHWRASTACVTEVCYNKSSDPDKRFRAEVSYISAEEWRTELESIFEDLRGEQASIADKGDEVDQERKDRIKQSFDKIKCVYPHINTRQKLESVSIDELLTSEEVKSVLGTDRSIEKRTRTQLASEITKYIDSGDHKDSSHWPLIKLVRVFVKSSVLEAGVVLVDLPGNLDNNAARSAIAEKVSQELSISCVVANISRGISNKNAADLLEKFTKRTLQLDGRFSADSLCFVLSKTDISFDYASYARQYPELGAIVSDDIKKALKLNGDIIELQRQQSSVARSHQKNKKSMKELSAEIKSQTSRISSSTSKPTTPARKRSVNDTEEVSQMSLASAEQIDLRSKIAQLEKQYTDVRITTEKEADELIRYGRRIKSLNKASFFARSRLMVQCIRHRNEQSSAAIRSDYEATLREMGRQPIKDLQVFPISASVHLQNQISEKRHLGFPNLEDTHISALREWIHGTTLEDRESIAQAFLDDVDAFLATFLPWIMDKYGECKMSAELRAQLEPHTESLVDDLEADLRSLTIKTETEMKELVQSNIYSVVPQAEKAAGAKAKDTAEKWAAMCHWSTHRKINFKRGVWADSKGRNHKWNEDLVHDFTTYVVKPWDLTFHRQFPQHKSIYTDAARALIFEFAQTLATNDMFIDVSDGIEVLKNHVLRTQNRLRSDTNDAFDEMKEAIKKAHRVAVPAVRGFLEPMYEHCASEAGTGHYRRNKNFIDNFMTKRGVLMHRVGKTAIKTRLDQLLDNVPMRLGQGNAIILGEIREHIKEFFDRNSADGSRTSTRRAVSNTKVRLQKDIIPIFDALVRDWKLPVQTDIIPDDDETEDEMELNDDLFVDLSKDDDDEDYADSDGEAA